MRFYSGFGFWNEKELFSEYLEEGEFVVAGFSYGAQKALIDAIDSKKRVDKLQLLSPAFFNNNPKFIKLQLNSYKQKKKDYVKQFYQNTKHPLTEKEIKKLNIEKYYDKTETYQLEELLNFNWGIIEHIKNKNIDIEIFIGSEDKIIDVKKAVDFFKNYGKIYFIKGAGHLLKKLEK